MAEERASEGFSDEERAAMRERARELKAGSETNEKGERDLLARIAEMSESERAIAERLHVIITTVAPELTSKTWYGMPAYAKDGDVICFFQSAEKFDSRYATLGFNDAAALDDGAMWPTAYALTELTDTEEEKVAALVRKAVS